MQETSSAASLRPSPPPPAPPAVPPTEAPTTDAIEASNALNAPPTTSRRWVSTEQVYHTNRKLTPSISPPPYSLTSFPTPTTLYGDWLRSFVRTTRNNLCESLYLSLQHRQYKTALTILKSLIRVGFGSPSTVWTSVSHAKRVELPTNMNEPDFVFRCVMELVTAGNLDNDNNNENDNSDEEGSRKRKRELQNNDDEEFDSDSDSESDIDNSATTSGLEQQRAWRHAKNVARFLGEMIARNQTRKRIMGSFYLSSFILCLMDRSHVKDNRIPKLILDTVSRYINFLPCSSCSVLRGLIACINSSLWWQELNQWNQKRAKKLKIEYGANEDDDDKVSARVAPGSMPSLDDPSTMSELLRLYQQENPSSTFFYEAVKELRKFESLKSDNTILAELSVKLFALHPHFSSQVVTILNDHIQKDPSPSSCRLYLEYFHLARTVSTSLTERQIRDRLVEMDPTANVLNELSTPISKADQKARDWMPEVQEIIRRIDYDFWSMELWQRLNELTVHWNARNMPELQERIWWLRVLRDTLLLSKSPPSPLVLFQTTVITSLFTPHPILLEITQILHGTVNTRSNLWGSSESPLNFENGDTELLDELNIPFDTVTNIIS